MSKREKKGETKRTMAQLASVYDFKSIYICIWCFISLKIKALTYRVYLSTLISWLIENQAILNRKFILSAFSIGKQYDRHVRLPRTEKSAIVRLSPATYLKQFILSVEHPKYQVQCQYKKMPVKNMWNIFIRWKIASI